MSDRKSPRQRPPSAPASLANVVRLADYRADTPRRLDEIDGLGALRAGLYYVSGDLRRLAAVAPDDLAPRILAVSRLIATLASR